MAVTEVAGKKFIQVDLGATGGNWVMSDPKHIKAVRLTGIAVGDYITFYEAYGSNPKIFVLDYDARATMFHGRLVTKIGFTWTDCSVATPADAVLSVELE